MPTTDLPVGGQQKPMIIVGKTFLYSYDSGLEVKGHYATATELTWEAMTGPSKGQRGTERIHVEEVATQVYFISWLETSGTSVSQVLDLNRSRVAAFVTYDDTDKGRQSLFDRGSVQEVVE